MGQSSLANYFDNAKVIEETKKGLLIAVKSPLFLEVLTHRNQVILKALHSIGYSNIVTIEYQTIMENFELPESDEIEVTPTYHDERNRIIQPERVEVHTQYFRQKWRPLLKPLHSELIRELRQLCYFGKGKDQNQRNHFKTTYYTLAKSLGVSESTIKRALSRNDGDFVNPYLKYFIVEMETIKSTDKEGKFRNIGTRFVIFMDEPLTPIDSQKTEVSN